MKVLAINSSPRMDKGNTALILNPFLEGMKEAGAEVELFYTKKLNINPCTGEFNCWLKTPGKCYHNDDMNILYPKIAEVDVIVFATPVYVDGVTGPMKNLIDRMIPRVQPFFELREEHCRHSVRGEAKTLKFVLISNCGFWEKDNFDPLLVFMKAFCKNASAEFAGALLRPHGEAMPGMLEMGAPINDIFEAAKEAGRQLAKGQKISQENLDAVSRELLPKEMYIQIVNQYFQQTLEALEKC
ncbi:iron-sulfur flavoprotein [Methanosarcina horonobensis HB-1 = JCM 15518]|uniref:Iron-sulfur flavoprotein n=1 Tax=Methanosarcina horonobensis HB-1 = JCM 15518 TaxID=1434110 RepID=A0A0E3WUJ7_9EURY|nr:flavodoxin family protein [Methanosarcina horonobensis]AKB78215.1 iron-sulfur flavoprotein [Methanosarcina horonobensis HB-1 = JCM 15518]